MSAVLICKWTLSHYDDDDDDDDDKVTYCAVGHWRSQEKFGGTCLPTFGKYGSLNSSKCA